MDMSEQLPHALQVITDGDGNWRWVLLAPTDDPLVFAEHSAADCDFDTYDAAAHAGLVALGAADGQLVEDERADPVGGGGERRRPDKQAAACARGVGWCKGTM